MNGTPYIMFDELYYKELQDNTISSRPTIMVIQLLNKYLDDNDYRNKMGERALTWTRDKLLFKNNMIEMSNYIDDLVKRLIKI